MASDAKQTDDLKFGFNIISLVVTRIEGVLQLLVKDRVKFDDSL